MAEVMLSLITITIDLLIFLLILPGNSTSTNTILRQPERDTSDSQNMKTFGDLVNTLQLYKP